MIHSPLGLYGPLACSAHAGGVSIFESTKIDKQQSAAASEIEIHGVIRVASPSLVEEMADSRVYHFDEVAKHNVAKDCWLIIDGKVYDVTPFIDDHPGGDEVLLAVTGMDATNDFEDIGHSSTARDMMAKYYIGEIDPSTVSVKRTYLQPQQAPNPVDKPAGFLIKVLQFLVPLLILGLAFAVRKFTKAD
ncbi:hypothetical protein ZIOFF_032747 [Zingiber officinale]|uniref:Cytochrome b5 heme-binding domain-containing protein n=2 Tax=Zingiber officinale TaxID=94328 RepID=A0A8J5GGS7_ZINOF|nr:hypothetical protein ZIOFF_032747 [Zingiber officinale]